MKKILILMLIGFAILFSGCGSKIDFYSPKKTTKAIKNRNYEFNKPKDVYFDYAEDKLRKSDILKDKPYVNYEIIFSGITTDTIRLLYREYSPDDMARNAFYQDLTYPINTELIRFKDIKIEVLNVSGEKIRFKVIN